MSKFSDTWTNLVLLRNPRFGKLSQTLTRQLDQYPLQDFITCIARNIRDPLPLRTHKSYCATLPHLSTPAGRPHRERDCLLKEVNPRVSEYCFTHRQLEKMPSCSETPMKIALFLDFEDERTGRPLCAQTVVKRIFDEGHHVAIFAHTARCKVQDFIVQDPQEAMERNVREADAILLLTDRPVYGVPQYLDIVRKYLMNGQLFSWNLYGVCCVLLGGSVQKRKVAMQLRHLLEDSHNLLVGRVLPLPCYLKKLYTVDPTVETEAPCVL